MKVLSSSSLSSSNMALSPCLHLDQVSLHIFLLLCDHHNIISKFSNCTLVMASCIHPYNLSFTSVSILSMKTVQSDPHNLFLPGTPPPASPSPFFCLHFSLCHLGFLYTLYGEYIVCLFPCNCYTSSYCPSYVEVQSLL